MNKKVQILVMGVSGSGKSTIGTLLAKSLGATYLEGDDFHTPENVTKMSDGFALTDEDRWPWLDKLAQVAKTNSESGFVMACSALKESYRSYLLDKIGPQLQIVYLDGDFDLIEKRMKLRSDHYMPTALLKSQFEALESPVNAWVFKISQSAHEIVKNIVNRIEMSQVKAEIGVLGLGVMGKSLARNFASRGISTAVYNVPFAGEERVVDDFVKEFPSANFLGGKDLQDFISSLSTPRAILLMIKAGEPVDEMIDKLSPLLDDGDIIIDGGNSYYKDSIRRYKYLKEKGLEFVGMGVSGGEEGALKGPAMMPAGSQKSKERLLPMFRKIAAVADEHPCVDWIGKDGAGHFVKMIHNGIEYADMQLLTEVYAICKNIIGLSNSDTANLLDGWKISMHNSYLLDISIDILREKEDGEELLEQILDVAGHKGTGLWTSKEALDLGVPIPTIACAMTERILSSKKTLRESLSPITKQAQNSIDREVLRDGFLFARLIALAEGYYLIKAASDHYGWEVNLPGLSQVWRGGCIIRSDMLKSIITGLEQNEDVDHLFNISSFSDLLGSLDHRAFQLLSDVATSSVATPALSSAISYYKSMKTNYLPINMIQAQRDYFGAHTYRKLEDREGVYHTQWGK